MIKVSTFLAESEYGLSAVPLFGRADKAFEKVASVGLLPEVVRYISTLRPRADAQYVLVNALGAGEYFSSNVNADYFDESGLMHCPAGWTGNPLIDKELSKDWPYGFPTFYNARAFAHHKNKDPSRAYGEVELAVWNDHMKRVELVVRVDYDKCLRFGGVPVWDRLKAGQYPDVSMGCLPAGSLVTMANGTRCEIEQVKAGDWVLSHTGARRRVTEAMTRRHVGTIYRFNVYGFQQELVLTGNHPLWLVDGDQFRCSPESNSARKWTTKSLVARQRHCTPFVKDMSVGCSTCSVAPTYAFEWRRADEANIGDYLAFPIPKEVDTTIQSRAMARLLGYYLAEGHVANYNERPLEQITFSLGIAEKDLAEEIEQLSRELGVEVLWHYERPKTGARYVVIVSKELADKCLRWCGSGSKTKQLSREVLFMLPELLLEFLGAYLNGDGGTYKGSAYFSTASEILSHQLFIALARCGLIASVNKIDHRPSECSVVRRETVEYQLWVGTDFSWKLGPVTNKQVRRSKKVRGQRFFYEKDGTVFLMAPILEIFEEDYDDTVFNFSVEEDESYVAEGLAVHNSRVPWDACGICTAWPKYQQALTTFDPKKHRHPGIAVLEFHKKLKEENGIGIRGLSITRADYCDHMLKAPNRILPDGRKVWVHNPFPRFFDISFVFIGADRTAKVMVFIVRAGQQLSVPSALAAEKMGVITEPDGEEKVASDRILEALFLKGAEEKSSAIDKEVVPSQFAGKAIPLLTENEPGIPPELMNALAATPLRRALATLTGLGMVLRPREFEDLAMRHSGKELDVGMTPDDFMPHLARLLVPIMDSRSALGPYIEKRVVFISSNPKLDKDKPPSLSLESLRKIGGAYDAYRHNVMDLIPNTQRLIKSAATKHDRELLKLAEASPEELFTPLAYRYFDSAFKDEAPVAISQDGVVEKTSAASVERGLPSRNTWM